jgi:hypothetical protein
MFLLDSGIFEGILRISTNILQRYFFYDEDSLGRFLNCFEETMKDEYYYFEETIDESFKFELQMSKEKRMHFTSYFVSYYLHDVLVYDLHFTEMELDCFENILPKYIGANDDIKQSNKRANH